MSSPSPSPSASPSPGLRPALGTASPSASPVSGISKLQHRLKRVGSRFFPTHEDSRLWVVKPLWDKIYRKGQEVEEARQLETEARTGLPELDLFAHADGDERKHVGCMQRAAAYVHSRGQVMIWVMLHTLATMVVFGHFFLKKWRFVHTTVPDGAPNMWQKRWVPSLESSAMHCITFNFALMPLTMLRFFFTSLRGHRSFARFFPLDHMVVMHKWLGYTIGVQLVVTLAVFFGHFGHLCREFNEGAEKVDHCNNFDSEIMITGFAIFGMFAIIWFTSLSFIRNSNKYEIFWYAHHFFLALYALILAHTQDDKQREGLANRSQTWVWLVFPLSAYVLDRTLSSSRTFQIQYKTVRLHYDPKSLMVEVTKPEGFKYKAGQLLYMYVPSFSRFQWHPFSIASAPHEPVLRLVIRTEPNGWTEKLFNHFVTLARQGQANAAATNQPVRRSKSSRLAMAASELRFELDEDADDRASMCHSDSMEEVPREMLREEEVKLPTYIMGPFGAASQDAAKFENVIMVSTGSGLPPQLSQLRDLLRRRVVAVQAAEEAELIDANKLRTPAKMSVTVSGVSDDETDGQPETSVSELDADGNRLTSSILLTTPERGSLSPSSNSSGLSSGSDSESGADATSKLRGSPGSRNHSVPRAPHEDGSLRGSPRARRRWVRNKLEGTRYSVYSLFLLAVDFVVAGFTLSLTSLREYGEHEHNLLQTMSVVTTTLYAVEALLRFFSIRHEPTPTRAHRIEFWRAMIDVPVSLYAVIFLAATFSFHLSYGGFQLFLLIMRVALCAYRVCMRYYLNPLTVRGAFQLWNRLPTVEREHHGAGQCESVRLLWLPGTRSAFHWLQDELEAIQAESDKLTPGFVDIEVHITDRSLDNDKLQRSIAGTALEGRVLHARPCFATSLRRLQNRMRRKSRREGNRVIATAVFYSGNMHVEDALHDLALDFAGSTKARFYFATENNDIFYTSSSALLNHDRVNAGQKARPAVLELQHIDEHNDNGDLQL